jgi:dUTP pyrophosphatase
VLVKKLVPEAVIPTSANPGDAGLDITAIGVSFNYDEGYYEYSTGLAVKLPTGFFGMLCARSSVSNKDLILCNGFGVIDENYTGELKFRFKVVMPRGPDKSPDIYKVGDRIGQLVITPYVKAQILVVDELPETKRGTGGYGSSGA